MIGPIRFGLNRLHRLLAGWGFAVLAALKLRNQCAAVIAYRLAPSPDPEVNGEHWLVRNAAIGARSFVDVGAHRGRWTSMLLEHAAADVRGLLFEPNEELVPKLRAHFGRTASLEICQWALGAVPGDLPFRTERGNGECSRIVVDGTESDRLVRVSTLDSEIAARHWDCVDVVKIDAEGYDFHVLRGAAATLARAGIGIVQFEYGDAWPRAGATLIAALGFLRTHGYATFLLQPAGLEPVRYERWGEHFSYSNYVAVAPQWQPRVEQWIRP